MSLNDENPYAPPADHAAADSQEETEDLELATLGERLGGAMLDGLIVVMVMSLGINLVGYFISGKAVPWVEEHGDWLFTGMMIIVNGVFLKSRGQTLGKMVMKTKIVRMDGSPAGFLRLIGL